MFIMTQLHMYTHLSTCRQRVASMKSKMWTKSKKNVIYCPKKRSSHCRAIVRIWKPIRMRYSPKTTLYSHSIRRPHVFTKVRRSQLIVTYMCRRGRTACHVRHDRLFSGIRRQQLCSRLLTTVARAATICDRLQTIVTPVCPLSTPLST